MFYETKRKNIIKVYRVLSCVIYSVIENYFCIDYISCHSKTLIVISSDKIFEEASYYGLIGIGIPSLLINLVSCHEFMKKTNSTVILVCQYRLVNYYLEKNNFIIEHKSKQLSSVTNDVKLRIHEVDKQETDYVMACTTEIYSLANTINILHIQSPLCFIYQKNYILINKRLWMNCFINTIFPY